MKIIGSLLSAATLVAAALGFGTAAAQEKEVTVAYQQIVGPLIVGIANGTIEKATGYKINWRQFDSGSKVMTAMASGDIQVGVVGSSPLTGAVSRGVDLQLFWILDDINEAEALIVRNGSGIDKPADLKGKKIAVPFVSTSHFDTMAALKLWGIQPSEVKLLNMQPSQIVAAWERGDIDAAFVWDPALARIKQDGKSMITAGELAKKGVAITFDGIAVDKKWGEAHADFMARFVKALAEGNASLKAHPDQWGPDSANIKAIASKIGGEPKDLAAAIKLYSFPSLEEQASASWLGGGKDGGAAKALKLTAEFLKEQRSINTMAPDYSVFVTSKYADMALKLK